MESEWENLGMFHFGSPTLNSKGSVRTSVSTSLCNRMEQGLMSSKNALGIYEQGRRSKSESKLANMSPMSLQRRIPTLNLDLQISKIIAVLTPPTRNQTP
jgi:hypothetical protein